MGKLPPERDGSAWPGSAGPCCGGAVGGRELPPELVWQPSSRLDLDWPGELAAESGLTRELH